MGVEPRRGGRPIAAARIESRATSERPEWARRPMAFGEDGFKRVSDPVPTRIRNRKRRQHAFPILQKTSSNNNNGLSSKLRLSREAPL
jgi:hypothetical protein